MKCNECLRKDYCPWIHQFNHDTSVGCIDFQDKDYTTYISNTLNTENPKTSRELTDAEVKVLAELSYKKSIKKRK